MLTLIYIEKSVYVLQLFVILFIHSSFCANSTFFSYHITKSVYRSVFPTCNLCFREKDFDDNKIVNSDESESFLKVEGKKNEVKVDKLAEMIHNIEQQNKKELNDDIYIPKNDFNAKSILNKDTKQPASMNTKTHVNNIVNRNAINNDGTSNILSNAFNERTIANSNAIKIDNDFVPQITAFKKPLENSIRSNIDSPHEQPNLLKAKESFKKTDTIGKNVEFPPMEKISNKPVLMKENVKSVEVSPVANLKDKSSTMLQPNTGPPNTGPPHIVPGILPILSKPNEVATPSSEIKPSSVVLNTTNKSKPSKSIPSKEVPNNSLKPLKQAKSEDRYITTFGLPQGWEKAINHENGRIYYIDHNSKKTHWKLPADLQNKIKDKIKQEEKTNADKLVVDKSTKRIAFKEERPSLKRSLSSPNLAEVDLGESLKDVKKESTPVIDRSIKPK